MLSVHCAFQYFLGIIKALREKAKCNCSFIEYCIHASYIWSFEVVTNKKHMKPYKEQEKKLFVIISYRITISEFTKIFS